MSLVRGLRKLVEEMELYGDLMRMEGEEVRIAISLTDSAEEATLIIGDDVKVEKGFKAPDLKLTMEKQVFESVLSGESDFGALIGRSRMSEVRPINIQPIRPERMTVAFEILKVMMTTFFNPGKVKIKELKEELAGEAHGAHPIPLVYWDGIRFAWYSVKKGEVLNKEGERDPYPQIIVILKGKGTIILDDTELELRPNTAIYIPVNSVHKIEVVEDVEVLWLAWKIPS